MTQERYTWDQDFDGVMTHDVFIDTKTGLKYGTPCDNDTCELLNQQAEIIETLRQFILQDKHLAIAQRINDLMIEASSQIVVDPEKQAFAEQVLTALGIEERLT